MWEVEYTDELGEWWDTLSEAEQETITPCVNMLATYGPDLKFPLSSGIIGSRYRHMQELRIQHKGNPYRIYMPSTQEDVRFY